MEQVGVLRSVHDALATYLPRDRTVRVLEAGGGSFTHVKVPYPHHISLLDISPEQLEHNTYADKKILGDLEAPDSLRGSYDLIVCYNVLEHLRNPATAFANMAQALADGGLLFIGCPNPRSLKGILTKFTPYGFHLWYYRHLRGIPDAGLRGRGPFPTFLLRDMTMEHLSRQAKSLGLESLYARGYSGPAVYELRERHPLLHRGYRLILSLVKLTTLGYLDLRNTEFVMVLRRPPKASAA